MLGIRRQEPVMTVEPSDRLDLSRLKLPLHALPSIRW